MKTAKDPRHLKRVKIMQELFAWDFNKKGDSLSVESQKITHDLKKIDDLIAKAAPEWPIEKINRIDLSILRLAIYELTMKDDVPEKVVIDEAVELGKEFGSESSPSFINGVLGKILNTIQTKVFTNG